MVIGTITFLQHRNYCLTTVNIAFLKMNIGIGNSGLEERPELLEKWLES